MGRPHLAHAVLAAPANRERLAAEGADTVDGMFRAYLADGGPAWVAREGPSVTEAVEMIHVAGGVAVWAHPFFDVSSPAEVLAEIDRFRADGLDGVECFYVTHTRAQVDVLCDHCERHGTAANRLGRLPRARPAGVLAVPRLRAVRARAGARADRRYVSSRSSR